ncbi:hypothetical protein C8Q79DRAFT_930522 [Trametes meyenii]|nr:hypothetical protein C8Q79DRAFT_930522 [Trametes meyenii]
MKAVDAGPLPRTIRRRSSGSRDVDSQNACCTAEASISHGSGKAARAVLCFMIMCLLLYLHTPPAHGRELLLQPPSKLVLAVAPCATFAKEARIPSREIYTRAHRLALSPGVVEHAESVDGFCRPGFGAGRIAGSEPGFWTVAVTVVVPVSDSCWKTDMTILGDQGMRPVTSRSRPRALKLSNDYLVALELDKLNEIGQLTAALVEHGLGSAAILLSVFIIIIIAELRS